MKHTCTICGLPLVETKREFLRVQEGRLLNPTKLIYQVTMECSGPKNLLRLLIQHDKKIIEESTP